jgi:outer membrane protein OmpA-like peptidoglycan-associated protein
MIHRSVSAVVALLLTAPLALAGCASTPEAQPTDDIVIVAGTRMGSPRITPEELEGALSKLDAVGDRVTVVVADGEPSIAADLTINSLPGNSRDRAEKLSQLRSDVVTAVLSHPARKPEVDLAEAIALGAAAFRDGTRHSLTVLDSGLDTAGALSLLGGRLWAEPADLLSYVTSTTTLPNLAGVAVSMPRIGVVVDPQPELTESARRQLTSIWAAYFKAAGATNVQLSPQSMVALSQTDKLPTVTPVPIDRPQPPAASGCHQVLGDSTIGFAAGSPDLTDTKATHALLAQVNVALRDCSGTWTVEGSASSEGEAQANQALSEDRASTVAAMLADVADLSPDDIRVVGWGEKWPCRVDDVKDGHLDLDAAGKNRVVVISKSDAKPGSHC